MLMFKKQLRDTSIDCITFAYDSTVAPELSPYLIHTLDRSKIDFTPVYFLPNVSIMFIGFPGTENFKDLIIDMDVFTTTTPNGDIHTGAYTIFNSVKEELGEIIGLCKPDTLVFSGHSMGAWVATLAADAFRGKDETYLFLFASPKLCDQKYKDYYATLPIEVSSYINPKDEVPRVPIGLEQVSLPIEVIFKRVWFWDKLDQHSMDNYKLYIKAANL